MRLGSLSAFVMLLGLSLSACGGESVEDRARALKAARQPAVTAPAQDPYATAPLLTAAPAATAAPTAPGSSTATPAPLPAP